MTWPPRVQHIGLLLLLAVITAIAWFRACSSDSLG